MNKSFLNNLGLLILRIAFAGSMLTHGYPKLQKLLKGDFSFADPLGIGEGLSLGLTVFGEFFAPVLILVGFQTRIMSIPPAIAMGVAAFMIHGDDPFAKQEKALLFLAAFVALALLGGGKFGIDGIMGKKG